ncbi:ATP-binding region [mine drainage metagenome]|uniref:ATP-binding region n=1 Tax=mine drainage metagenome TaxID=410659 RepID=A0A1J5SHZ0_9ZZZZ
MQHKSIFNWSGGKDSALALYHALQNKTYSIERLITSVNNTFNRISMHGVRDELLVQQAIELDLPLQQLRMNDQPTMSEYNDAMEKLMIDLKEEGFTHSVFGDIFLEDLRKYREDKLAQQGFTAYFPLWKRDTTELVHEFIDLGFKTITVCVKSELLDESFAGRIIDKGFLKDLPKNVDPCGENGEFHTFVFDGPIFKKPIPIIIGEKVFREYLSPKNKEDNCFTNNNPKPPNMGFWFCDLLPV